MSTSEEKIGIVGLGYVGLPLASAFSPLYKVVGFDINPDRIEALKNGHDATGEVEDKRLGHPNLSFTANLEDLASCTVIIITVPTPIRENKEPDLTCVIEASRSVAGILQKGMLVVYESTVYPGVTEDICLPLLEKHSGLKLGEFDLGYSPERVNPGDKEHTIEKIKKVVSGHSKSALKRTARIYGSVIVAGIHEASSIMTAEAAKVIENVQRDLNIALMNELSKIFSRLNLNTHEVLEAAGTKWNFHKYHPGLVGGHCIGVDPYYLTFRAEELGYRPEVILAGREINDSMGHYLSEMTLRKLEKHGVTAEEAHIWVIGLTFKENVPDLRNTRAIDVVRALEEKGVTVSVWEPLVPPEQIKREFGIETKGPNDVSDLDAVIFVNAHDCCRDINLDDLRKNMRTPVLVDVKNMFTRTEAEKHGFSYICL